VIVLYKVDIQAQLGEVASVPVLDKEASFVTEVLGVYEEDSLQAAGCHRVAQSVLLRSAGLALFEP
jgi:hypothetical protein